MADATELTVVPDYVPKPKEREIGPRKKYTDQAAFDQAVKEWEQYNDNRQALAAQLEAERKRLRSKKQVRTHPSGSAGRRKAANPGQAASDNRQRNRRERGLDS